MNLKNRNRTHRAIAKGLFKWNSKWTYESDAYLERFARVCFTGGKVENSTILILRKITFPYKGHCYCWVNAQKFRSPDFLTYGRRDKTRVFILFSKVLRNNCIDRYSLQHAQRRPHHLNNWNKSDVFLQAKRTGDDLFKGHQSMQNGDYGDQWHLRGKKRNKRPTFSQRLGKDRCHMNSRRPFWCTSKILWGLDSYFILMFQEIYKAKWEPSHTTRQPFRDAISFSRYWPWYSLPDPRTESML